MEGHVMNRKYHFRIQVNNRYSSCILFFADLLRISWRKARGLRLKHLTLLPFTLVIYVTSHPCLQKVLQCRYTSVLYFYKLRWLKQSKNLNKKDYFIIIKELKISNKTEPTSWIVKVISAIMIIFIYTYEIWYTV